ncbi:unnamed protein product [Cuscuta campestris]|uniref:Uncharacterized protein n=1 Tax=Cuscuta campestris TaxID=132261 RepID=A0A484KM11_9ASTE|nr:unnamed protein product [Cuscuta campestris]
MADSGIPSDTVTLADIMGAIAELRTDLQTTKTRVAELAVANRPGTEHQRRPPAQFTPGWRPPPSRTTPPTLEPAPRMRVDAPRFSGEDPTGWIFKTSSVMDYQSAFETILNKVSGVPEATLIAMFIAGLKQPAAASYSANRKPWQSRQTPPSGTGILPTPNPAPRPPQLTGRSGDKSSLPVVHLSPAEKTERNKKGLCWYCDEKWVPGHNCKHRFLVLMGPDDDDEVSGDISTSGQPEDTITGDVSSILSLAGSPRSLKMAGSINGMAVQVLLDGGSTHNFLHPAVAERLALVLHPTPAFRVYVGNGDSLRCAYSCPQTPLSLQGHVFEVDLYVLSIHGPDVVLGVQWPQTLGKISHDYSEMTMEFSWQGRPITLRGDTPTPRPISYSQFCALAASPEPCDYYELVSSADTITAQGAPSEVIPADVPHPIQELLATNRVADALSRREDDSDPANLFTVCAQPIPHLLQTLKTENSSLPDLVSLHTAVRDGSAPSHISVHDGVLYYNHRLYISPASPLCQQLLHEFHATPTAGHQGVDRTFRRLAAIFFWPGMRRAVCQFVASCTVCQATKYSTQKPGGLLQPLPIPDQQRMCAQANRHRREVVFNVSDMVLLRLQPYRQHSLARPGSYKLAKRFYGPFEVLERVGPVAYRLRLPETCRIHNVFHVSLLRPYVQRDDSAVLPSLPLEFIKGRPLSVPVAAWDRRRVLVNGEPRDEWLVQWSDGTPAEATWEPVQELIAAFPDLRLEDKAMAKRGGVDTGPSIDGPTDNHAECPNRTPTPLRIHPNKINLLPTSLLQTLNPSPTADRKYRPSSLLPSFFTAARARYLCVFKDFLNRKQPGGFSPFIPGLYPQSSPQTNIIRLVVPTNLIGEMDKAGPSRSRRSRSRRSQTKVTLDGNVRSVHSKDEDWDVPQALKKLKGKDVQPEGSRSRAPREEEAESHPRHTTRTLVEPRDRVGRVEARLEKLQRRVDREEKKKILLNESPFTDRVHETPFPKKAKLEVPKFTGKEDPEIHVKTLHQSGRMMGLSGDEKCLLFFQTLRGRASEWFHNLLAGEIDSFDELAEVFQEKFKENCTNRKKFTYLSTAGQREHEDLTKFLTRWKGEVDKVEEMDDKTAMSLLVSGLRSGELYKEFCRRPPQSYQEAYNTAWDYADAEAQVSSKREAEQGHPKGKISLKKEIELPGRAKAEVMEDLPATGEDHNDPLVITMDMGGVDVSRVLVYTGSSVNVLYLDAFEKLKLCRTRLEPLKTPLSGFTGDSVEVEGSILLNCELGTGEQVVQKQMRFVVVNIKCVHNAILGWPGINKVRGVISMAHLCMKFYTPGGIGQVRGDQKKARHCYLEAVKKMTKAFERVTLVSQEEDRSNLEPGDETEQIVLREAFPERMVRIGRDLPGGLRDEIISVLREYADIFAWSVADMPGIDRSVICHRLAVMEGSRPVKQKKRHLANVRRYFVKKEVKDLLAVGHIREGQALADFLVELTGLEPEAGPSHTVEPWWDMAVDGASGPKGCGAGVVFTTPEGFRIYHALIFNFRLTNNEAEYEALAGGLRLARKLGIKRMKIRSDSSLVVGQVNGEMEVKEDRLARYSDLVRALLRELEEFRLTRIPRSENADADMLSKLTQACPEHVSKLAKIEVLDVPSTDRFEVAAIQPGQTSATGIIGADDERCRTCQVFYKHPGRPATYYQPTSNVIPFTRWGIDIIGAFPVAQGGKKFVMVAIDYFTKWIEAEAMATITVRQCEKFVWKNIITRFGAPKIIVTDNGPQFRNPQFSAYLASFGVKHSKASVAYPQGNSQVENANRTIVDGLKKRLGEEGHKWLEALPHTIWAHRVTSRRATGETPFVLTYGCEAWLRVEAEIPTFRETMYQPGQNEVDHLAELNLVEERRTIVAVRMAGYQQSVKRYHDNRVGPRYFQVHDEVLRRRDASKPNERGKLARNWEGPFRVKAIVRPGTYQLETMEGGRVDRHWNSHHLRKFFR